MQNDENRLKKRFTELYERAEERCCYTYTEFLNIAEQDILLCIKFKNPPTLFGGYGGAERCVAVFGSEESCGYEQAPPICCVSIAPVLPKMAEELSHRDFLGALIALGIRREVLGDIVISGNTGYLFCLETVADFIISELCEVRRTSVKCSVVEKLPACAVKEPEDCEIVIASERLDAIIAAVYKLSRTESQKLFLQRKIFVNSRLTENFSHTPLMGDIVSVRGEGRFIYNGIERETRKGRLRALLKIYR